MVQTRSAGERLPVGQGLHYAIDMASCAGSVSPPNACSQNSPGFDQQVVARLAASSLSHVMNATLTVPT